MCDTAAGDDDDECIEVSLSVDDVLHSTLSNATPRHLSSEAAASSTADAAKRGQ